MLGAQELGERLRRGTLWGRESRGRCLQGGRVPEGFPPTWFQTARPSHPPHILPTFPALTSPWHLPTFRLCSSSITVRHTRQCRVREGRD